MLDLNQTFFPTLKKHTNIIVSLEIEIKKLPNYINPDWI